MCYSGAVLAEQTLGVLPIGGICANLGPNDGSPQVVQEQDRARLYSLSHWQLAYDTIASCRKRDPEWIPLNPDWSNYQQVFVRIPFWSQITNSIIVTLTIVVGQLTTASLAGYAFARLEFPGRNVLFWLVMATMMIPLQATIIPVFVLISRLNLTDTLASLILPALPTAFGTFLLRQYFMGIPKEFEEAATIDGATPFQIFYRVYLPLVAPGQAVLAILAFNQYWNEFFRPLVFLLSNTKFTIPLGLNDLKGFEMTGSISVVLAGVVLSLVPVVFVYFFGQRYLIEGIMMGGIKA
jgi:multiple sugar transport system permease protein